MNEISTTVQAIINEISAFNEISPIVQAISSVIALFIAIFVPYSMDKKARKRQEKLDIQKENNLKIALLPLLYELRFKSLDFITENQNEYKDVYDEEIEISPETFDSEFWKLIPKVTDTLLTSFFISDLQDKLRKLAGELFSTQDLINETSKLQRHGYHSAWSNHKDLFLDKAKKIYEISNEIISLIETENQI